jgi:bacillithiol synthase
LADFEKGLKSVKVSVCQEKTANRLTDAHDMEFSSVAHLYDHQNSTQLETYEGRSDLVVKRYSKENRQRLTDALATYAHQIGASETSLAAISELSSPDAVAVVTGQQAGLFTGPLYSLSKALTAVGMAKELSQALLRPVIPVFWIASEDHDWGEVNHAYVISHNHQVKRMGIPESVLPHTMVYHQPLSRAAVEAVLQATYKTLPVGPASVSMMETLRSLWHEADTLSIWFARIMAKLLSSTPLVFFDPCLPELRALAASVWVQALSSVPQVQSALKKAYAEVETAGFAHEVVRDETNSTVFYVEDGKRYVLEDVGDGMLRARSLNKTEPIAYWTNLAKEDSTRFSANVLLRPVIQDTVLPTLAYIGGPSELAYYPLARAVFHTHGRTLPPLIMRQRMTFIPPTVSRQARKWGVHLDDPSHVQTLVKDYVEQAGGFEANSEIEALGETIASAWNQFTENYLHIGPQLPDVIAAEIRRQQDALRRVSNKVRRLWERQHHDEIQQLLHIESWMWMDGHPQERRLSPLNLWALFGAEWFSTLPAWGDFTVCAPHLIVEI